MHTTETGRAKPAALSMLASERPRNVGWLQAAGLLFGDWGTSRLYVLGLAFLFAGRTSFWLICAMSLLILAVGWAYTQICRIYPDGGGVYTAAKHKSRMLAVVGALLLFADYTVTASLSVLDSFHYFGLPLQKHAQIDKAHEASLQQKETASVKDAGGGLAVHHDETPKEFTAPLDHLPFGLDVASTGFPISYDAKTKTLTFKGAMTTQQHNHLISLSDDMAYHEALEELYAPGQGEALFAWDSPGLWAIFAIGVIGMFNLMGPKHTGGFAIFAAIGMVGITLLISISACLSTNMHWSELPHRLGNQWHHPGEMWIAFVSIVLALSGVEAIANLTGVMQKPVAKTANKAIWVVATEVAVFNILLAIFMLNIFPLDREQHVNDMLAFLSGHYIGAWGEWAVRIVGGLLLLSAGNTAITDMISVQYLMARDGELPRFLVKLNRFGVPWIPAFIAAAAPILILIISHNLEALAALYAIGVVGAVAINVTLCSMHPRLRRMRRKVPMMLLGILLLAIWVTLACTKLHALLFVTIVMLVGLTARGLTKWLSTRKGPKMSLLQQAIIEQLPPDAWARPKMLIGTYGSDLLAPAALEEARKSHATLVVCFIREVHLSYKYDGESKLTVDTDHAAQRTFARFLELGHQAGVPILPVYDTGHDAAELMAENAAMNSCEKVLIGTSRKGALYHL
ncbi:MAG TPA: amino acid permease, partial [Tepidisphaeraceae bacterium]|nr:amino acid permease [Tepidisphaeraceae bacterium]